jgi:parallel beta-helix repeat protein
MGARVDTTEFPRDNVVQAIRLARNTTIAISLFDADRNRIEGNTLSANADGIRLSGSSNNRVVGNSLAEHTGDGIWINSDEFRFGSSSDENLVQGNTVLRSSRNGIFLGFSSFANTPSPSGNRIVGNTTNDNGLDGIFLDGF